MNNIWNKNVNAYNGVINSYTKMPSSSKIRGTLLKVNENSIKVSIGNEKSLDIVLDKPFEGEVGDAVVIDRQNIVESKLVKSTDVVLEEEQAIEGSESKYTYILKSCDIPVNDESIEAVEILDNYGVDMTKENILSFMYSKEQLSSITEKLDYDTAVKLIEKDVDFEKESLQKVLQEMQNVQGEKRPFSLLRFLGIKKDMSTEEAEKIAYNLYGNKMGKDITDIIKALDKAGLEISKSNIEEINNIFSKLHNIKNIEDKTIVDSVKNKIETSIDNLYKLKNAVVKGSIKVEEKIGQLVSKVYGAYSGSSVSPVTETELDNIEGDIRSRLENMGIKVTEELVRLSKDVIVRGLDLTKENLEKIIGVKGAIVELNSSLDYEKTALLMASGVAVDKVDVAELANMINVEHITENVPAEESIAVGLDRLEILELIEVTDKMKNVVDALKQISPERKNSIIPLLMKNSIPMTLKQVQNLSFFLSNQRQIGHQLDEILNLIDENNDAEIVKIAEELENAVNKINEHIKEGRQIGERPYEEFSRLLKDLESKSTFLSKEDKGAIQKSGEKLLDSLELQLQLNREDTLLQLPLMMSDQLKNLQIYIMRDKRGSKKIDPKNMSVLLNFDTNNMGNVNIYVAVNYKNIVMKMGLSNKEDQDLVEKYSKELKEHLEDLGYDLKNLSFRIDDDNHILSMVEETEGRHRGLKRLLDVRI